MYDDLINALRHCAECDHQGCAADCRFGKEHPLNFICVEYLQREAADAIEELQTYADLYKDMAEESQRVARKVIDNYPKWIPVTERLPEDKERVLIFYWLSTKPKTPWYKVATFSTKLSDVDEYDLYGKDYPGFYGSDSEYGYYEHTDVEYWMPLPKAPEKESES